MPITGLEINFEEDHYSIVEGGMLSTTIRIQFRQNQSPFTVVLCPVSISEAESRSLGFFLESDTINEISRATPGWLKYYYAGLEAGGVFSCTEYWVF